MARKVAEILCKFARHSGAPAFFCKAPPLTPKNGIITHLSRVKCTQAPLTNVLFCNALQIYCGKFAFLVQASPSLSTAVIHSTPLRKTLRFGGVVRFYKGGATRALSPLQNLFKRLLRPQSKRTAKDENAQRW